ncbi:hypothetical protein T439DRAFT_328832 [Meredithblackwellia eburnea MCA 4105]
MSASAVNAIWTVGTTRVKTSFTFSYIDVSSNPAYYTNKNVTATQLFLPVDFEALAFAMGDILNAGRNTTAVSSTVDGLNMTIGNGVVPSLQSVSSFRQYINTGFTKASEYASLEQGKADIISKSTDNEYTLRVPTTVATSHCASHFILDLAPSPSTLTLGTRKGNDSNFYYVSMRDTTCSPVAFDLPYAAGQGITGSSWGCFLPSTGQTYTSYFLVWPAKDLVTPLASCNSTVAAGIANVTYQDLTSSYNISDQPQLSDPVDVTESAWDLYFSWFAFSSLTNGGSPGLTYLVHLNLNSLDTGTTGESWGTLFKTWSEAALAMSITKLVNTNTIYDGDPAWINQTSFIGYNSANGSRVSMIQNHLPAQAISDALVIGPSGYTALLLIVMGLMFILLCGALVVALSAPPVTLNPLDPVSVLLVAQNSPPSIGADGGCLGNVSQVRDENVPIQYRAVNSQHLAFVFGDNYYEAPKFGRM